MRFSSLRLLIVVGIIAVLPVYFQWVHKEKHHLAESIPGNSVESCGQTAILAVGGPILLCIGIMVVGFLVFLAAMFIWETSGVIEDTIKHLTRREP